MMYRLAWFLGAGFGIQVWNPSSDGPWTGSNVHDWMKPDLYVYDDQFDLFKKCLEIFKHFWRK